MDDLISRQAINDLQKYRYNCGDTSITCVSLSSINELPSGNPQKPKWDRLYSWLNDMRFGIAPDETVTDIDERIVRTAQVDLLDEIMEWMVEPQERSDKE